VGIGLQLSRNVGKWGRRTNQRKPQLVSKLPQRFSPRKAITQGLHVTSGGSSASLSTYKPGVIIPSIEQPTGEEYDERYGWQGDLDLDDEETE